MSAARERRCRVDLDRLREQVGIADILRHFGHEVRGERGRTCCPVHAGENASSFSYDHARWHCFACGEGGDVFDLIEALMQCGFREALAVVAQLAGMSPDGLPQLTAADVERRAKIQRRREALRRWRDLRLTEWLHVIAQLDREARLFAPRYLDRSRDQDDPDGDGWRLLASLHADQQTAEVMAAALLGNDEDEWARTWLAEQSHELPTPEELWP